MTPPVPLDIPDADLLWVSAVPGIDGRRFASPLGRGQRFVADDARVLVSADPEVLRRCLEQGRIPSSFELAGPRDRLAFDPRTVRAAIVTCGGLCPGLNDVVRSITMTLRNGYGAPDVIGYRFGFLGLGRRAEFPPMELTLRAVDSIHEHGGTLLGASRGPEDTATMVDTLVEDGVDMLFAVGGDGTLRAAGAIADEIAARRLPIAVVGVPKTIDNDLWWVERSFGFATAVEEATRVIRAAHAEAHGHYHGVGLVKLMGRHSGFIAAHSTLASADVNLCLVPEVPFVLDGAGGLMAYLEERLVHHGNAVVVVAEGAGQELLPGSGTERDPSGNVKLADVGTYLRDAIVGHLDRVGLRGTVKYIDPSYIIRSLPSNAFDSEFCLVLGQQAAHAAMGGRTRIVVGYWHHHFTHVPIAAATGRRLQLDPSGGAWQRVLQATGQPPLDGSHHFAAA
jgi:6-phosphofructokinase 1